MSHPVIRDRYKQKASNFNINVNITAALFSDTYSQIAGMLQKQTCFKGRYASKADMVVLTVWFCRYLFSHSLPVVHAFRGGFVGDDGIQLR